MRMCWIVCFLCLLLVGGLCAGLAASSHNELEGAASRETDRPKQRVILRVNRNTTVKGIVEHESDEVIVVRWKDKLHSYSKTRIKQIVRMTEPKPGQTGIVILNDGSTREGVILEDTFDHVLLEVQGIRNRIDRAAVDHVQLEPSFEQKYARYKSLLRPGMHEQRIGLAKWLVDEHRYELAHKELADVLAETDSPAAEKLLNRVDAQLELIRAAKNRERRSPASSSAASERDEPADRNLPDDLLTRGEVNLIRVFEIDFDNPPRLEISHETIRKLIEKYAASDLIPATADGRNALFRKDPVEIAKLMFALRARDLYPEIRVLTEPHSMNIFRETVHDRWLLKNCATSRCHGGLNGGRLFLHRSRYKNDRVRYTNFLILDRLELGKWPLINYEEPTMSLIIQHALPRSKARLAHPRVKGWRPAISHSATKMIEDGVDWITSMYQPRPKYPVDYQPPEIKRSPAEQGEDGDFGRVGR